MKGRRPPVDREFVSFIAKITISSAAVRPSLFLYTLFVFFPCPLSPVYVSPDNDLVAVVIRSRRTKIPVLGRNSGKLLWIFIFESYTLHLTFIAACVSLSRSPVLNCKSQPGSNDNIDCFRNRLSSLLAITRVQGVSERFGEFRKRWNVNTKRTIVEGIVVSPDRK